MQTRYDTKHRYKKPSRPPNKPPRQSLLALRLLACITLLALTLLMRTFFPGATYAVRATVLPRMEEGIDYRATISAIGETLSGEGTFLEVLGDLYTLAFGTTEEDYIPVQAYPEAELPEPVEPEIPRAILPPIGEVIYLPLPDITVEEEEALPPEAVGVFLARQEAFYGIALPQTVCLQYYALGLEKTPPLVGRVSSPFGFRMHPLLGEVRFHFGTDIAAYGGTPFYAMAAGRVSATGAHEALGNYIFIDHGNGVETRYAHASAIYISYGQEVEKGQMIGRVGQSGSATGPHLHFELLVNGLFRNPEFYVQFS